MRRLGWMLVLAAATLAAAPPAALAQCTDLTAVRRQVADACPCSMTKRGPYRRCVAAALRAAGVEAACRAQVKAITRGSLCGRKAEAVVCCERRGRRVGSIARSAERCPVARGAEVCTGASRSSVGGAFFDAVFDVCSAQGTCRPLPHPCGLPGPSVELTTTASFASCGRTADGAGTTLRTLGCGTINVGGGAGAIGQSMLASGAASRWLADCDGDACELAATLEPTACWDCTGPGCSFGPPQPIPNGGTSVCLVNTFTAPSMGTLDRATGAAELTVPIESRIVLTGVGLYPNDGPCPVCSATANGPAVSGSPEAPGAGVCDGGRNAGLPCRTTNAAGLSRDCPPGGVGPGAPCDPLADPSCADGSVHLGALPLSPSPLSTAGSARQTSDGLFCADQRTPGCFANATFDGTGPSCRRVELAGAPAGPLVPGVAAGVTLGSVLCIPGTGNGIVDFATDIPGPGALSLVGTLEVIVP